MIKKPVHVFDIFSWAPFILYLVPALAGFFAVSESASILGRYSLFLAALNVFNLLFYVFIVWAFRQERYIIKQLVYLLVILLSFIAVGNTAISELPFIPMVLPLLRLLAGWAIVLTAFQRHRQVSQARIGIFLTTAAVVVLLAIADLGLLFYAQVTKPNKGYDLFAYRTNYSLSDIRPDDIIIVGDSFVWGAGVKVEERFGSRLQEYFAKNGLTAKVYNLGIGGAGPSEYLRIISSIPDKVKARQIILAYYLNDIQLEQSFKVRMGSLLRSLGKTSLSMVFIQDMLQRGWVNTSCPDVACYHRLIVKAYDKNAPTFKKRWARLASQIRRFRELSSAHSDSPPIFMVIPIMDDFRNYPLENAHRELVGMALEAGYKVIDLLPLFSEKLVDGSKYRASINDNHFDARVHALTAGILEEQLNPAQRDRKVYEKNK